MNSEQDRLDKLRSRMQTTGTDLVALGPGSHMEWLIGFHPHADERPCLLLVSSMAACLVIPDVNVDNAREQTRIPVLTWRDENGPADALAEALASIGTSKARTVAVDETMRADFALLVLDRLPGASHEFTQDTVGWLRLRKDAAEVAGLKASAAVADEAILAAFNAIRPGMTELNVSDVIGGVFASHDATPLFRIVGSGGNGALPHYRAGRRELQVGDAVVIDIGARAAGWPSDITRMAVVGRAPEGFDTVCEVVEAAVQAALAAAQPGVKAREVDAAARQVISAAGYGDYFIHRTGHGMGIDGHEPPFITSTSETILEEGMVFSIEPGIYLPGRFGVRLEDIIILRQDGPEILSSLPRDYHLAAE